jgi:hypothetical protein
MLKKRSKAFAGWEDAARQLLPPMHHSKAAEKGETISLVTDFSNQKTTTKVSYHAAQPCHLHDAVQRQHYRSAALFPFWTRGYDAQSNSTTG